MNEQRSSGTFRGNVTVTFDNGLVKTGNAAGQIFIPLIEGVDFSVVFKPGRWSSNWQHDTGEPVLALRNFRYDGQHQAVGAYGKTLKEGGVTVRVADYESGHVLFEYIVVFKMWANFTDGIVDHGDSIAILMKEYDMHVVTVYPYGETTEVQGSFYTDNNWLEVFTEQGVAESDERAFESRKSIVYGGITLFEMGGPGSSKRIMRMTKEAPLGTIPAVFVCEDGRMGMVNLQKI